MERPILVSLAAGAALTGFTIFFAPHVFYDITPGVRMMGPFNVHFIRDVALAFLASGGAMAWGAWHRQRSVALAGAAWPFLHALFHIQIWGARGFPFDTIAGFDFAAVISPATLALVLAWRVDDDG